MKKSISIYSAFLFLVFNTSFGQTTMKDFKIGHPFNISLPSYMTRTLGLNDVSVFEYKSTVKDVYGFVIEDNKEELALVDLNYSSINEFTEDFMSTFLKDQPSKKTSKPIFDKKGNINFAEFEASYFDEEGKIEIFYLVGIVETKTAFYKILSWSAASEKDKFKDDFKKIIYSLND